MRQICDVVGQGPVSTAGTTVKLGLNGPQKRFKVDVVGFRTAVSVNSIKIGVSFLAEGTSSAETKIIFGQSRVIISVFDCFVGIDFVGESHEPIIITSLSEVQADVDDRTEDFESSTQVGSGGTLGNFTDVYHTPLFNLPLPFSVSVFVRTTATIAISIFGTRTSPTVRSITSVGT